MTSFLSPWSNKKRIDYLNSMYVVDMLHFLLVKQIQQKKTFKAVADKKRYYRRRQQYLQQVKKYNSKRNELMIWILFCWYAFLLLGQKDSVKIKKYSSSKRQQLLQQVKKYICNRRWIDDLLNYFLCPQLKLILQKRTLDFCVDEMLSLSLVKEKTKANNQHWQASIPATGQTSLTLSEQKDNHSFFNTWFLKSLKN